MSPAKRAGSKGRRREMPAKSLPVRSLAEAHFQRPPVPLVIAVVLTAVLEVLDITIVNVAIPNMLGAFATTSPEAAPLIMREIGRQAQMLAFNEIFWFIAIVTLAIIPLIFMMKRPERVSLVPA